MEEFDKKAQSIYDAASLRWQAAASRRSENVSRSATIATWVSVGVAVVALFVAAVSLYVALSASQERRATTSTMATPDPLTAHSTLLLPRQAPAGSAVETP